MFSPTCLRKSERFPSGLESAWTLRPWANPHTACACMDLTIPSRARSAMHPHNGLANPAHYGSSGAASLQQTAVYRRTRISSRRGYFRSWSLLILPPVWFPGCPRRSPQRMPNFWPSGKTANASPRRKSRSASIPSASSPGDASRLPQSRRACSHSAATIPFTASTSTAPHDSSQKQRHPLRNPAHPAAHRWIFSPKPCSARKWLKHAATKPSRISTKSAPSRF